MSILRTLLRGLIHQADPVAVLHVGVEPLSISSVLTHVSAGETLGVFCTPFVLVLQLLEPSKDLRVP